MPFSHPVSPADTDLLSPVRPNSHRQPDHVPSTFDRSILGIPAENDEYTRGLIFLFDPSTGHPSVHSTSSGSDDLVGTPPYEPSLSSNNTSSRKVNTPQSDSDAPTGLHPELVSSPSIGSPDVESSDTGVEHHHHPSVSSSASFEACEIPSSNPTRNPADMFMTWSFTPSTISPTDNPPMPGHPGPSEGMDEKYSPDDFGYLANMMGQNAPSQMVIRDGMSDGPIQPENAQDSAPNHEGSPQRLGTRTTTVVMRTPKGPSSRTGPIEPRGSTKNKMDKKEAIEKVKMMRRLGVCLPCLVNHEPCDTGEICPKCQKSSPKIQKTPCVRPHLSKAVLFRIGALSYPMGVPEPKDLAVTKGNKFLVLYNIGPADPSVPPESRPRLMVKCRPFPVTPGIRSFKSWTKGASKIDIHLPNVAMTVRQRSETARNLDVLVEEEYTKLVDELATGQDDIVLYSLAEAKRQSEKCRPIKAALQMSIISRLASKSFNICGPETLGIRQETDPDCPYYKRRPIPPLLDAQIDALLMDKMENLKKFVLSELRRMIAGQSRKHWFKIYLIIVILLLNLESVYQNQRRQIQRYQESNPQQETMLQSWKDGADNLILHFRAVCRGHIPLNMEWNKADQDAAEVDDLSLDFIRSLNGVTQSRADELLGRSRASPETPLAWISALFVPQEKV